MVDVEFFFRLHSFAICR